MLKIENLRVAYGQIEVLHGVSLHIDKGKIICVLGANGAGKTTLLNTISGINKIKEGSIIFEGAPLASAPHIIAKSGIIQIPEGRKIFAGLSVKENLIAGAYLTKDKEQIKSDIDRMYQMFPRLKEREKQQGGTLSGGEQQMLAIARGLMSHPKLLLLDEPSLGLAPSIVKEVFKTIEMIKADGMTILLVEQNAKKALSICDNAYVLRNGKVVMEGSGKDIINDEEVQRIYLGERQEDE